MSMSEATRVKFALLALFMGLMALAFVADVATRNACLRAEHLAEAAGQSVFAALLHKTGCW